MTANMIYGNHQYELVTTAKTWAEASQYAFAQGGHLAYVESSAENSALRDFLLPLSANFPAVSDGGGARYVWLGGNDIALEGVWRWASNTAISGYTNWGSGPLGGEPDNYQGAQDAMAMGLTVWPYPSGGLGQAGQWNDINENNKIYFLVEWDGLIGTTANDRFSGGVGVTIDGRDGIDTVVYSQPLSIPVKAAARWQMGGDTLINVERLQFSDANLALDIDGNAGKVAKILAAVFGASAVSNKTYAGIGLNLMDGGMSYEALAALALNAAGAHTREGVVDLLWTNLMGSHPSSEQAKPFVDFLAQDLSNAGALGCIAADFAATVGVVNLTALGQTGLGYV